MNPTSTPRHYSTRTSTFVTLYEATNKQTKQ